jgi:sulfatase maturation enzyme AslB (radical SAM superfamily)
MNPSEICAKRKGANTGNTSIFFLTERCNLDCEYCYEAKCRKDLKTQKDTTEQEIVSFLTNLKEQEPDTASIIRLLGGEPLLRMDLVEFFIRSCHEIKPTDHVEGHYTKHGFAINLITNGTVLSDPKKLDQFEQILSLIEEYKIGFALDVSYDGSGNHRRVFNNSRLPSTDTVLKVLDSLQERSIQFGVSYAVHKDNHLMTVEDFVWLCERYKESMRNIKINYVSKELAEIYGGEFITTNFHRNALRPYAQSMFKKYGIPVCSGVICDVCGKCEYVESTWTIGVPGGQIFENESVEIQEWDYFKSK